MSAMTDAELSIALSWAVCIGGVVFFGLIAAVIADLRKPR
jgi:hypothetical protein